MCQVLAERVRSGRVNSHQPVWREQLTSALISLGFAPKDSDRAITTVVNDLQGDGIEPAELEMSELLKRALQSGGRK